MISKADQAAIVEGLQSIGEAGSIAFDEVYTATEACIAAGVILLIAFYFVELRTTSPLMEVRIFKIHAFRMDNLVLGIAMVTFVPLFFFASEYAEIALGESASQTGLYILYFFLGFAGASQIGGRMLDRDTVPIRIELLGEDHRERCLHSLADFRVGGNQRNAAIGRDPDERVGHPLGERLTGFADEGPCRFEIRTQQ